MNRIAIFVATSLLASSTLAAESVATLSNTQGIVSVNQGEEFVAAQSGQALMAGNRIMVGDNGSGTLTFNDGCVLTLDPGTIITVPEISTCAGGMVNVQKVGSTRAVGAVAEASSATKTAIIVGSVAVGAALALGNDDDEDDTASP
jgi:hypothetical protein